MINSLDKQNREWKSFQEKAETGGKQVENCLLSTLLSPKDVSSPYWEEKTVCSSPQGIYININWYSSWIDPFSQSFFCIIIGWKVVFFKRIYHRKKVDLIKLTKDLHWLQWLDWLQVTAKHGSESITYHATTKQHQASTRKEKNKR